MERRSALAGIGGLSIGTLLPVGLLQSCRKLPNSNGLAFTTAQIELIDEIGEVIIPATDDSGGAKEARVGIMVDRIVAACISPGDRELLTAGLSGFDQVLKERKGRVFTRLSPEERHEYIASLDNEARVSDQTHYFSLLKKWIVFSFFTSEEGMTKALRYVAVPGKQVGDYPYNDGDRSWAL